MNYKAEEIANYIDKNVYVTRNSNWTIYEGPNGLTHTTRSAEYRDEDYKVVMGFMTMDEVPEDMEELLYMVEFQMNH